MIGLLLITDSLAMSSSQDEIQKRKAELESLRDKIKEYEVQVQKQQQNERATLELLDTYDKKASLLRSLITRLKGEERRLQVEIDKTRKEIGVLAAQLKFLKDHFGRYVASVYRSGRLYDLELLLSSRSINQFYIRTEYLKRFSEQRRSDAEKIGVKKTEIEDKQARLQVQLSEERRVITEKAAEEDRLAVLVAERKDVLKRIRQDKKSIQREMERKIRAAKELENLIASLIEADRLRKEREAGQVQKGKLPQPPPVAGSFELKKGKLRWPVPEGRIVARFGTQTHPTLKTVTQNTGIDIAVNAGSPVSTVADGEVRVITWLPSFGNVIILDHANGYRTVYTHLGEIRVVEGQVLKEGDVIGLSGEALDGPRLHFEVWKEREKQNPEIWLSRQ
jgi:septal ring factor EnvC (AmiA/AmiB activator)